MSAADPGDEPPEQRGEPDPDRGLDGDGQLRPGGEPLEEAAEHEPGGGADRELHGAPRLLLQRAQPRARAGADEREPEPQAGDAADRTGTWTGTWEGGGGSADGAEVVLAATFEGNACKGTCMLREKANGNEVASGGWKVV